MILAQIKAYKNEMMVGLAGLLLLIAFVYKQGKVSSGLDTTTGTSVEELKEVIALKKVWGNKKTTKKVDKLKTLVPSAKVAWSRKSKKLTVSFKDLNNQELNRLISKIMNLPVEIQKLEVKNLSGSYSVEFKCKW